MLSLVAEAIAAQHALDIFHQDLKTTNIYVGLRNGEWDGQLVVADYGIGRQAFIQHHCGTPGFGSPEQFSFYASEQSDIFALGKMAIQIIFPVDKASTILENPMTEATIRAFRNHHPILEKFHDLLSRMLQVVKY